MRISGLMSSLVVALLVALVVGLAGCGGDDDATSAAPPATTSQSTANEAFCASLDDLGTAAADLKALDPSSTSLDQLSSTVAAIGTAWTAVENAAKDAKGVNTSALSDAWNGVRAATRNLAGSGSVSAAAKSVEDSLAPLEQAVRDLRPECGSTTDASGSTTNGG